MSGSDQDFLSSWQQSRQLSLREYGENLTPNDLIGILRDFGIDTTIFPVTVEGFIALSPDSFVWQLSINGKTAYLYAEDYIPGLEHVKATLADLIGADSIQLAMIEHPSSWEEASPVVAAESYAQPADSAEIMKYAAQSGPDFVFLGRVAPR